jgi:BCD family chlorophyll transporter-like MFS transporter
MNRLSQRLMRTWIAKGTRYMPFADAATPDLPLSRLLRLSLFQVAVGMALVLVVGTLNRVMIVELGVPAWIVGVMIALPVLFAPFRALIGFKSDNHRSELGWRRVPFMYRGTLTQFAGLSLMPFAILVLGDHGQAAHAPEWVGITAAAFAFLLVGAGLHTIQTVGLALATDLVAKESRPNVVGLMYVMLLLGMMGSALVFGWLLEDFTAGRLIQVIQASALVTLGLMAVALWKQEPRDSRRSAQPREAEPSFREAWTAFSSLPAAIRLLIATGLGTMGFSMADVLMEPYGGQILNMSVAGTTKLTATLAMGGLLGFGLASHVLRKGADPIRVALVGALAGGIGFGAVVGSGQIGSVPLFTIGTLLIGFGAGLFGHGTLTETMNRAPKEQTGLALGAWGAVQATGAGVAIALGGVIRDGLMALLGPGQANLALAYHSVYLLEAGLLLATIVVMFPLLRRSKSDPTNGLARKA